jgi:tetratricopeptide (TPR) repeat protein
MILVLVLAGVLWVGYRVWTRGTPDYYRQRAEAAREAGDIEAASLYLRNLVGRFPDDAQGHLALAEVYLEQANAEREEGQPTLSFANHPKALFHLAEAAKRRPDDPALQKPLLEAYLKTGQLAAAARVADRLIEKEPEHADALFVLAWRAVGNDNLEKAEPLLARLAEVDRPHALRGPVLQVQTTKAHKDQQRLDAALEQLLEKAAQLSPQQVRQLSPYGLGKLPELLFLAVAAGEDRDTLQARADMATGALQTLHEAGSHAVCRLAREATRIASAAEKTPLDEPEAKPAPLAAETGQRIAALQAAAIEQACDEPVVYYHAARRAAAQDNDDKAMEILAKGIAAGEDLPEERRPEVLNLHLLAARRLIDAQRYDEARPHVETLIEHERSAGQGHLLAGGVALSQRKWERARDHFLAARRELGNTLVVRSALAQTYIGLHDWKEALDQLEAIRVLLDNQETDSQPQAMAAARLTSKPALRLALLQARLGLGQWEEAQALRASLAGTEMEPNATAIVAGYLAGHDRQQEAAELLAEAREQFPDHVGLLRADVALKQQMGEKDQAGEALRQAAADAPEDLRKQLELCQWQIANGKADDALKLLNDVEDRLADTPQKRLLVGAFKAQAHLALDEPEKALALVELLRDDPRAAAAAGILGAAAEWKRDNPAGVSEMLAVAEGDSRQSGKVALLQGHLALVEGEPLEALDRLSESFDVSSLRNTSRRLLLAAVARVAQNKSPQQAQAKVDELLVRYPEDPALLLAKAELCTRQRRFDAAVDALDRLEKRLPEESQVAALKAAVWAAAGQPQQVLDEATRGLADDDENVALLLHAGRASLALGNHAEARNYAIAARSNRPDLLPSWQIEANALVGLGRADEAADVLGSFIERNPQVAPAYMQLAGIHRAADQREQALEVLDRAAEKFPESKGFQLSRIELLAELGKLEPAGEIAESLAEDNATPAVCLALGRTFMAADAYQPARAWWRRALDAADAQQKPGIHLLLGNAALKEARAKSDDAALLAEARDHYAAVLEAEPNHLVAANNLAWILANDFDQPEKAVELLIRITEHAEPGSLPANFYDTAAVVYRKADQTEAALEILRQALESQPEEPKLLFQLGRLYAESNEIHAARQALKAAMRLGLPDDRAAEVEQLLAMLDRQEAALK